MGIGSGAIQEYVNPLRLWQCFMSQINVQLIGHNEQVDIIR